MATIKTAVCDRCTGTRNTGFAAITRIALLGWMLLAFSSVLQAQSYDLLLKGGHVIDPKNNIDEPMDVGISDGKIVEVSASLSPAEAETVVDASGLYVTPGLIDLHGHHYHGTEPDAYLSNSFTALPPDGFTFRAGVTTTVDVGGAGWRNFDHFKEQVIDRSRTRVLAFLNIIGSGMKGGVIEQNNDDMDPKMTALVARQHPEVVGVKIAHYRGHEWGPYEQAVEAGERAGVPVMVDFGSASPPLSLEKLLLEVLRPGDIYTHMYGGSVDPDGARQAVIDEDKELREGMLEARDRGIVFDVGHGGGSFFYPVAIPAFEQGLRPTTISTDLHTGSMNDGMKNMLNVVSKMMDMGMSLGEVIEASTWTPAQVIGREDLGHLSEGAVADVAVFGMREGDFGFVDSRGNLKPGADRKLETELTIREGEVVYDLNGLAASPWDEEEE
ncbi:dihydroorotase [Fodinibius roseus]|uniref:Dihydroorotase n=2 Tax=Fodinibius roseus TaxID=1194090 RepID=A0A1M4W803_9BACT|nr:amidohydrolase/deacetylase family metallohydrolase [Fodinibius roseus]SHE77388.1 dihydroorotase [Fodinibius roseus]